MRRLPAFSLIEFSVVVLLAGVILVAVFKGGRGLMDAYRLQETSIQIASLLNQMEVPETVTPKIGGHFFVEEREDKKWLTLGETADQGVLSRKQAQQLKKLVDDQGEIRGCDNAEDDGSCLISFPMP